MGNLVRCFAALLLLLISAADAATARRCCAVERCPEDAGPRAESDPCPGRDSAAGIDRGCPSQGLPAGGAECCCTVVPTVPDAVGAQTPAVAPTPRSAPEAADVPLRPGPAPYHPPRAG